MQVSDRSEPGITDRRFGPEHTIPQELEGLPCLSERSSRIWARAAAVHSVRFVSCVSSFLEITGGSNGVSGFPLSRGSTEERRRGPIADCSVPVSPEIMLQSRQSSAIATVYNETLCTSMNNTF